MKKKRLQCPKCGSENIVKTWDYRIDAGDPSTIALSEEIDKWGYEAYTIICEDCGYELKSDIVQPGERD